MSVEEFDNKFDALMKASEVAEAVGKSARQVGRWANGSTSQPPGFPKPISDNPRRWRKCDVRALLFE